MPYLWDGAELGSTLTRGTCSPFVRNTLNRILFLSTLLCNDSPHLTHKLSGRKQFYYPHIISGSGNWTEHSCDGASSRSLESSVGVLTAGARWGYNLTRAGRWKKYKLVLTYCVWYLCTRHFALPPLGGWVPKVSIPRGPGRNLITSYNRILEVILCHFFQSHKPTQFLVKGTQISLLHGRSVKVTL